ncbi:short-chain dehydrogenase [Armillaria borealis]|uniref:Short-chain dehydrogenase n=1 Tax=Armillaria borealis TaxID=47425 RepID=A0AA39MMC3_9AGAR|nr:short-chain dehydrogenase [Armillaria borealis]
MADLNMSTVMSLSGRVALVTGGGTGIYIPNFYCDSRGFNIAKTFAANGAKVYITGRRLDVLEKAAASITGVPGSSIPFQMDVAVEEDVKAGAKYIQNIDGKLDILVNNAGIAGSLRDPDFFAKQTAASDPLEPETVQNWADIFALNTIAPFFVVRALQSLLIEGAHSRPQGTSSIINISSVSATYNTQAPGTCMAYSVTKAALDKLTLVLGMSFAERGIPIRVNALQPGFFASQTVSPQVLEAMKTKIPGFAAPVPVRRHGTEAEIGTAAIYLAVSDYTNGALLSIEGGISLVNP